MSTPSLTLGQALTIALLGAALVAQRFGWISADDFVVIAGFLGVHQASDAVIRHGRASAQAAAHHYAAAQLQHTPPDQGDLK